MRKKITTVSLALTLISIIGCTDNDNCVNLTDQALENVGQIIALGNSLDVHVTEFEAAFISGQALAVRQLSLSSVSVCLRTQSSSGIDFRVIASNHVESTDWQNLTKTMHPSTHHYR